MTELDPCAAFKPRRLEVLKWNALNTGDKDHGCYPETLPHINQRDGIEGQPWVTQPVRLWQPQRTKGYIMASPVLWDSLKLNIQVIT